MRRGSRFLIGFAAAAITFGTLSATLGYRWHRWGNRGCNGWNHQRWGGHGCAYQNNQGCGYYGSHGCEGNACNYTGHCGQHMNNEAQPCNHNMSKTDTVNPTQ